MLFGVTITPVMLVIGGATMFLLLTFQVLEGKRRITFKGPLHMKIHRWSAYAMLAVAVLHAFSALAFLGII